MPVMRASRSLCVDSLAFVPGSVMVTSGGKICTTIFPLSILNEEECMITAETETNYTPTQEHMQTRILAASRSVPA